MAKSDSDSSSLRQDQPELPTICSVAEHSRVGRVEISKEISQTPENPPGFLKVNRRLKIFSNGDIPIAAPPTVKVGYMKVKVSIKTLSGPSLLHHVKIIRSSRSSRTIHPVTKRVNKKS